MPALCCGIQATMERVAHWLPSQGPIKDFIHHNPLHAFQEFEFFEGCGRAARVYGSRCLLPLSEYRRLAQEGEISLECLSALAGHESGLLERLLDPNGPDEAIPESLADTGLRSRWKERGVHLDRKAQAPLFRLVGQFLDQGISMWRMPHVQKGLFAAVGQLVSESWLPLEPFSRRFVRSYFGRSPAEVVSRILGRFLGREEFFERYLLEMCLSHPGWSGMVAQIELHPQALVLERRVSLLEVCALELMAELAYVEEALGPDFSPLVEVHEQLAPLPLDRAVELEWSEGERLQQIWQKAYESTYARQLFEKLSISRSLQPPSGATQIQAFFCIDDRECSLRRHLESLRPDLESYGTAGFFGIDCLFQGVEDAIAFKHCPAPVQPRHLIREVPKSKREAARRLPQEIDAQTHTLFRGFLISQTLGFGSALKLAISLFRPSISPLTASSLRRLDAESELQIERHPDQSAEDLNTGYSPSEMADRVQALLHSTGALQGGSLAPLVVFFGHGASSVNNPYFSAYDCGACSGKAGAPNARAFALMANHPQVRALLLQRGCPIPEGSWFLGALHDTTRDEVQFCDLDRLPGHLEPLFESFQADLEVALQRNARERCRKFALVRQDISERAALQEVRRRSISIFEPRPELNHATNACCIVGRRSLTQGGDLERRSFLNSYDPELDPEGEILTSILSALAPVCGGINLEYYFSRVDPEVYGAGSKLPQSVNGLIGVMNGVEGDLVTGLPTQMTELHPPLRLLMLVEHRPQVALQAISRNESLLAWFRNGWIGFAAVAPEINPQGTRNFFVYRQGQMVPWEGIL